MFQRVNPTAVAANVAVGGTASPKITVSGDVVTLDIGGSGTAADLSIECSYDGSTWKPLYNADSALPAVVKLTTCPTTALVLGPLVVGTVPFIRVVFSVAQASGRTVNAYFDFVR